MKIKNVFLLPLFSNISYVKMGMNLKNLFVLKIATKLNFKSS